MAGSADQRRPSDDIDFYLEDIMLRLHRIRIARDDDENNSEAALSVDSYNVNGDQAHHDHQRHDDQEWGSLTPEPTNQGISNHYGVNYEGSRMSGNRINARIAMIAMSPSGSQELQNLLAQDLEATMNLIFDGVFVYLFDIVMDQFGSHVFAKIIERCDHHTLQLIVVKLTINTELFVDVLFNTHGSNSVKRLIKVLRRSPLASRIASVLASEFLRLMSNRIASYVILKCFEFFDIHQNQALYEVTIYKCLDLATDERACIALNDSFKYLKRPYRDQLFETICCHARFLSQDPSGNYVVQKVLELDNISLNNKIYSSLKGHFVNLSTEKASSHVVEKCLECDLGMNYVLQDFLKYDKLWKIARDQYGNYVVQKALRVAKSKNSPFYPELVKKLYKDKDQFKTGYGRNVYAMITSGGA